MPPRAGRPARLRAGATRLCAGAALLACAAMASAAAWPWTARACMNVIVVSADRVASRLVAAEERLAAGDTVRAVRALRALRPLLLRGASGHTELDRTLAPARLAGLRERFERVVALAVVRREGLVDRSRLRAGWVDDATRRGNLEWAAAVLGRAARARPDSPEAAARYAEALARLPGREAEAARTLETLAAGELVPEPQQHALRAALALAAGRGSLAAAALERCHRMAGAAEATLCGHAIRIGGR